MSRRAKLIQRMRTNPRDWHIADLKALADYCEIDYHQAGSHVTFRCNDGRRITVPAHKPIKPIYILKFLDLIDMGD